MLRSTVTFCSSLLLLMIVFALPVSVTADENMTAATKETAVEERLAELRENPSRVVETREQVVGEARVFSVHLPGNAGSIDLNFRCEPDGVYTLEDIVNVEGESQLAADGGLRIFRAGKSQLVRSASAAVRGTSAEQTPEAVPVEPAELQPGMITAEVTSVVVFIFPPVPPDQNGGGAADGEVLLLTFNGSGATVGMFFGPWLPPFCVWCAVPPQKVKPADRKAIVCDRLFCICTWSQPHSCGLDSTPSFEAMEDACQAWLTHCGDVSTGS